MEMEIEQVVNELCAQNDPMASPKQSSWTPPFSITISKVVMNGSFRRAGLIPSLDGHCERRDHDGNERLTILYKTDESM